jgi:hypothetical protein
MVIDYKRFQQNQQLLPGTLWVVEQIPGLVERYFFTSSSSALTKTNKTVRMRRSNWNVVIGPATTFLSSPPFIT